MILRLILNIFAPPRTPHASGEAAGIRAADVAPLNQVKMLANRAPVFRGGRGLAAPPNQMKGKKMIMIVENMDGPELIEFNYDPSDEAPEVKAMEQPEELRSDIDSLDFS